MTNNTTTRRDFMTTALATAGACACPCLLCANPKKAGAPFDKNAEKPLTIIGILIRLILAEHWLVLIGIVIVAILLLCLRGSGGF